MKMSARRILVLCHFSRGGVLPYVDDYGDMRPNRGIFIINMTSVFIGRVYLTAVSLIDRVLFRCYFLDRVSACHFESYHTLNRELKFPAYHKEGMEIYSNFINRV